MYSEYVVLCEKEWHSFVDLLGGTLARPVPPAVGVDVGDRSALVHRIEGQEVDLLDSSSSLRA